MFKILPVLMFMAFPAYSNQLPYNNPSFLKISGGDPKAAQQIEMICSERSLSEESCADNFAGQGNFAKEAAQFCYDRMSNTSFIFKISGLDVEIPGSRMNKIEGAVWHNYYVKSPETGRMHRHQRSESDERRAIAAYESELITQAILKNSGFGGSVTKTSQQGVEGGIEFGISTPVTLTLNLTGNGGDGKSTTLPLLTPEQKARIEKEKHSARGDLNKGGIEPSIVCYQDEATCSDGSENRDFKNSEKKNTEKKTEVVAPESDEEISDIPVEKMLRPKGPKFAGESIQDVSGIATPIMDPELAPLSALDRCIASESKRLNDEFGKRHIYDNESERGVDESLNAYRLLKTGYCDESYFGVEYCKDHAFQQDSVMAVSIQEKRKDAATSALASFKRSGICDPMSLGREFCANMQRKWKITPTSKKDVSGGNFPKLLNPARKNMIQP